jgi:methylated-DNA-[protein]-cysteine S-methyltransferase
MKTKLSAANTHCFKTVRTPVGLLKLVASAQGLAAVLWENDPPGRVKLGKLSEDRKHPVLVQAGKELREYFAGKRERFSLKLDPVGTEFQRSVWTALRTIPHGETRTYAQIARQIGRPKAVRAVGAANGRNPLSIIAPCHRVIGADGSLTGFAGGLPTKEFLLKLEASPKK